MKQIVGLSWFDNALTHGKKDINANKVFIMSIGMTSQGVDIMIYDIHIEQVLSMKYLGTYINN